MSSPRQPFANVKSPWVDMAEVSFNQVRLEVKRDATKIYIYIQSAVMSHPMFMCVFNLVSISFTVLFDIVLFACF